MGAIELLRKKALMNGDVGGYAELKYLQSSGHQWFTIPLHMEPNDFFKDLKFKAEVYSGYIYGTVHNNSDSGMWNAILVDSKSHFFRLRWSNRNNTYSSITGQNEYIIHGGELLINGLNVVTQGYSANESTETLAIFAGYDVLSASIKGFLIGKIFYFDIAQNIISNSPEYYYRFVPHLRLSDNKPGMLDLVSGEFYVNQGTGEFGYETLDGTIVAPI